jgi:predicted DNA-binding transcriptional regulator YafY
MPSTKQFEQRLDILDDCLRQRDEKWTAQRLLDEVNRRLQNSHGKKISIRTLYGDIEHLTHEMEAPVEKWRDGQTICFRYSSDDYSIHNLPVRKEDVQRLREVTDIITQVRGPFIAEEVSAIVNRLENTVFSNLLGHGSIIQFEDNGLSTGSRWLTDIFDAAKDGVVLAVDYEPYGEKRSELFIHPYLLKEYRNRWYLVGRKNAEDEPTILSLDRIAGLRPTSRAFLENDMFDPETYNRHLIGVSWPDEPEPETVRIRILPGHVSTIGSNPIHESQRHLGPDGDGSHLIEITVVNNPELRSTLMSHGPALVVESPKSLREQIREMYETGIRVYGSGKA